LSKTYLIDKEPLIRSISTNNHVSQTKFSLPKKPVTTFTTK